MSHSSSQLPEKAVSGGAEARLLGKWGEQLVAEDLRKKGWRIVEVNFRCRHGEVDIIAANRSYLAFVEVKLRRSDRFGQPREFVTGEKQRKLRATAEFYLAEHPTRLQPRFDVAEVHAPQGMKTVSPPIIYMENAF